MYWNGVDRDLDAFAACADRKLRGMEGTERDSTQDWLLPEGSAPPLLADLELRIDEALAIARASEESVGAIGAAAIDAAKQARRAAEMAERASEAALGASRAAAARPSEEVGQAAAANLPPAAGPAIVASPLAPEPVVSVATAGSAADASLRNFSERADRVVARLRALERRPRGPAGSSAASGHRRPGG
jgi:hypothetical protein